MPSVHLLIALLFRELRLKYTVNGSVLFYRLLIRPVADGESRKISCSHRGRLDAARPLHRRLADVRLALNQKIDAYIAENKEQLLQDIAALVAIDSVEGTPEEGAPFGAGPRAALDKTLELAAGMGFATRNCENYIGYAELAGADPEKYLATICHVDVVPEGNGWTEDPFKMEIRDGWMIGRGVADDKGPMVATLYALKFLKEEGVSLRYPIRALVGDNEETSMADVK